MADGWYLSNGNMGVTAIYQWIRLNETEYNAMEYKIM